MLCATHLLVINPIGIPVSLADDVLTKDAGECVICLEELLQGDTIARLPCLCIYHKRYMGLAGTTLPIPHLMDRSPSPVLQSSWVMEWPVYFLLSERDQASTLLIERFSHSKGRAEVNCSRFNSVSAVQMIGISG